MGSSERPRTWFDSAQPSKIGPDSNESALRTRSGERTLDIQVHRRQSRMAAAPAVIASSAIVAILIVALNAIIWVLHLRVHQAYANRSKTGNSTYGNPSSRKTSLPAPSAIRKRMRSTVSSGTSKSNGTAPSVSTRTISTCVYAAMSLVSCLGIASCVAIMAEDPHDLKAGAPERLWQVVSQVQALVFLHPILAVLVGIQMHVGSMIPAIIVLTVLAIYTIWDAIAIFVNDVTLSNLYELSLLGGYEDLLIYVFVFAFKVWSTFTVVKGNTGLKDYRMLTGAVLRLHYLELFAFALLALTKVIFLGVQNVALGPFYKCLFAGVLSIICVTYPLVRNRAVPLQDLPEEMQVDVVDERGQELLAVFANAQLWAAFHDFCKERHCEEEAGFWKEADLFKDNVYAVMKRRTNNEGQGLDRALVQRMVAIRDQYLSDTARSPINISSMKRQQILKAIWQIEQTATTPQPETVVADAVAGAASTTAGVNVRPSDVQSEFDDETWRLYKGMFTAFDGCQDEVFRVLVADVFLRFMQTKAYVELQDQVATQAATADLIQYENVI